MLNIVFMGTPGFSVPALEYLILNDYQVSAVYTQPDRTAGRGRSLISSPVKKAAEGKGLPVVQPENLKDARAIEQMGALAPDVIVVYAFGQILPQAVLDIPSKGCINIHPSLLPKYRGAAPVAGAILSGDLFTGVSIMLMDAGMDTGPLLAQARIAVSDHDNTGLLTEKLSLVAARLLVEVLPRWLTGEITPRPQDDTAASYTKLLTKQEGEIDWNGSAEDTWRKVRAFYPWPGCCTTWRGKQLKIIEAVPLPRDNKIKPGQVTLLEKGTAAFGVGTGDGVLGVLKVQLEGKKAISAAEFTRGQSGFIGDTLTPV